MADVFSSAPSVQAGQAPETAWRFPWGPVSWLVWVVASLLGIYGVWIRFTQGHLPFGYGSYVPWGLWVALYFHGVGIGGGAFVCGAVGYLLGAKGFRTPSTLRTTIVLSAAAILPAFMAVWFDLGHMDRAHRIFTSPAFTSMMAFNAWMYAGYLAVAAICWALSFLENPNHLKPLLCLGLLLAIMFPSQSGAFFGVVDARTFWHSALLPMLFLASALTAGAATLLATRSIFDADRCGDETVVAEQRLRGVVIVGLLVYFVFEFAEFSIALWNPYSHRPAVDLILFGPYWWVFWIVHLLLGGLIPLALFSSARPAAWTWAAILVAVAFVSARLNVLVPGQAIGEIEGLQEAFQHPRLKYLYDATLMEYLLGFFLLAVGMAVFYVGQRIGAAVIAASRQTT